MRLFDGGWLVKGFCFSNTQRKRTGDETTTVRLWTIQPVGFWEASKEKGVLRSDGRRLAHGQDFRRPYRWLRGQMKKSVPGYGGRPPLWFWTEKPDMRKTCWAAGGLRMVRLEVEVPEERVLVSDFLLWHTPLNGGYLGTSEADDDAFYREVEERLGRKHARVEDEGFPEDLKKRALASWERIFPDRWHELGGSDWLGEIPGLLQACAEEIRVEEVVRVGKFTTRYGEYEQDSKKKRAFERSIKKARMRREKAGQPS